MGRLGQPLNTFWQLFFRPADGLSRWSDEASALAVATNGGLVLATPDGRSLAVGIRPANRLDFSPLVVTSDGGRSWSPAAPLPSLAKQPDALAVGPVGRALSLTTTATGDEVLESREGLASWHLLTTANGLGSSPAGHACGLVSITAVGSTRAGSFIGAGCRRAGVVGIFSASRGGWRLVGPSLPSSLHRGGATVVGLRSTNDGLCALVAVSDGHDTILVAAWTANGGGTWRDGPALKLGSGQLRSFGPDGETGLFVLSSGTAAPHAAEVISGPGAGWRALPALPINTATLVFGPVGRVDALAVSDDVFADWVLRSEPASWTRAQVMNVPIEFGSSG